MAVKLGKRKIVAEREGFLDPMDQMNAGDGKPGRLRGHGESESSGHGKNIGESLRDEV